MLTLLLCVFVALLLLGMPIGFAMLGSSMLVIGLEGIPVSVVAQRVATSVQSLFTYCGLPADTEITTPAAPGYASPPR